MTVITIDFINTLRSGSGSIWSDTLNALVSDNSYASSLLDSGSTESQLLILTGGDFSSIPPGAKIRSVKLIIEANKTGVDPIEIHEVYAWDGSVIAGDNQASTPSVISGSDVDYTIGDNNWGWWTLKRLHDTSSGIAARMRNTASTVGGVMQVDYVRLQVDYEEESGYAAMGHAGLVIPALIPLG